MLIKKFKTKYHKYIFQFSYSPAILEKVKIIQSKQPEAWRDLSFYKDEVMVGWVFSSYAVYTELVGEFEPVVDPDVEKEMEGVLKEKIEREEAEENLETIKKATLNSNLEVETRLPLFPFQKEAVDFVDKVGGKALIADDMGMGKTIEAIGYAVYKEYSRVLVICPASVKENWKREIKKFSGIEANLIQPHSTIKVGDIQKLDGQGWEIVGYSNLESYWKYFKDQKYDLIIIDEAHYIKNRKAVRSRKVMLMLKSRTNDAIFLTGTPILNKPSEIYNIFNYIRPMNFWGSDGFAMRYCGLKQDSFGRWDYTGATNLDELKDRMSFMIKRDKKNYLEQLPDKTINIVETSMADWSDYNDILDDFREWLKKNNLNEAATYAEALTKASYLKQAVVNNKKVEKYLDEFLNNGQKMIVFSQYRTVIDNLHKRYEDRSVKLTGLTPTGERQALVDKFQTDRSCRVFFSTIKAGGVGLTLTEADCVVFTDLSWTPADHAQAEDRAWRIGQKNNVNVYYLITPDTIEEKIWKMLKRKETMINQILEGKAKVRKVHVKTLLKNL